MTLPVGIGYSGGTSSRWMIDAILNGEIMRPEHVATEARCQRAGIPFFRGSHRELLVDAVLSATRGERKRVDNPPFWTENPGGGRGRLTQRCSKYFKTDVIRRMQSAWLLSLGMPKKIECWIGFANDEQARANKAIARKDVLWQTLDFPAIRLGRNRAAQRADIARWGLRSPLFSMCRKCPFKSPQRWRQTTEKDLDGAFMYDEAIRHGLENVGVVEPCFVTDRLISLERLVRRGDPQPDLPGLEAPGCDEGACFL